MVALISGNPFSVMEIGDSESEGMPEEQHGDVYTFSFPEPTICFVSGGIVGLWYQPLPDVVNFTTSGSACLIR